MWVCCKWFTPPPWMTFCIGVNWSVLEWVSRLKLQSMSNGVTYQDLNYYIYYMCSMFRLYTAVLYTNKIVEFCAISCFFCENRLYPYERFNSWITRAIKKQTVPRINSHGNIQSKLRYWVTILYTIYYEITFLSIL